MNDEKRFKEHADKCFPVLNTKTISLLSSSITFTSSASSSTQI
ncbi:unnamed protein product, partial [Rotaria sp. Silwood1]